MQVERGAVLADMLGMLAFGMAMTPGWRSTQASATWAGVAAWPAATLQHGVTGRGGPARSASRP